MPKGTLSLSHLVSRSGGADTGLRVLEPVIEGSSDGQPKFDETFSIPSAVPTIYLRYPVGGVSARSSAQRSDSMAQEEEILGKAYDSRLMRRLLAYLRPYRWQVAIAIAAIIFKSIADVLGPYLVKVAVDRYLAPAGNARSGLWGWLSAEPSKGIAQISIIYFGLLLF